MKELIRKAPLYIFIYISLILVFILSQYYEVLGDYFPEFRTQGSTISAEATAVANTIEIISDTLTEKPEDIVDEAPVANEVEEATPVEKVVEEPVPTPIYGEPLEDIIARTEPSYYYKEAPVKLSYFDDAVFIGDSRTVGLKLYSGWDNCDFLADVGMTIFDCLDRDIEYGNISHTSVRNVLTTNKYSKIYLMLGINECGSKLDTFIDQYTEVVEQIHKWQPNAVIIVQSIMCVGAQKSASHASINNPNIQKRNERLSELANGFYIYYLDINPAVCDGNGNLTDGYSFDQVHLYAKYYTLWCDYLLDHGFVFSGLRR